MVQQITVNELIRVIGSYNYKTYEYFKNNVPTWRCRKKYIGQSFVDYQSKNIDGKWFRLNRLYKMLHHTKNVYVTVIDDMFIGICVNIYESENDFAQQQKYREELFLKHGDKKYFPKTFNTLAKTQGSEYIGIYKLV